MASKFGIKLSVSVADLITSIQKAIEKINKSNALKDSPINVRANKDVLIDSIKKAIKSANSALSKSDDAKVKLGVNQDALINSITSGVRAFNRQTGTEGKTVKLTADLDITAALKKLQAQLAKNNLVGTNVTTDSTAKTADTEKQKKANTDSLISSIKQKTEAEREYVQLTLDSYTQEIEKEKQRELAAKNTTAALNAKNKALETENDLLRQRTNYADAAQLNPTTRATTYGNSYKNTTYFETFNAEQQKWESNGSTVAVNLERLNRESAKAYDTVQKLNSQFNAARASYTDLNASKPIDSASDAFKRLEAEGQKIVNMFPKISEASGITRDKLISDTKAAIEQYKLLIKQAQNEQYAATSLRTKDIPTIKAIEANNLDTLRAQLVSTHIPASVLIDDFQRLTAELNNVKDKDSLVGYLNNLDIFKAKAQSLSVIFKQIDGSMEKLNSASGVVNSSGFNGIFGTETVGSLNTQITELTDKLNTLKTAMTNAKSPETVQENINSYNQLEKEITDIVNAVTQLQSLSAGANGITNKLSSILNPAIFKQNGSNERVVILKNQVAELDAECRKFLADLGKDVSPEGLNRSAQVLDELQAKFADLRTQVNGVKNALQQTNINGSFLKQQQGLIAKIQSYIRNNPKAMGKINPNSGLTYGEEFDKLNKSAQAAANSGAIKQISYQTAALQAQIKAAGQEGQTFFSELTSKAAKFIKWTGMTLAITKARMYIRQLFTTVYELDTALIDLKKTFNGTDEELNQFYTDSNKLAKQLGVTTKEIIKQGSAWSRLGYSSKESMETMAKMSSMFAAISPDMNTDQATNGLVAIMKAFDIDPDKVLDEILSKVNIIGNTAATSNGEIVEMLERSSSAMKEANNTLEETIALETAAVEITRDPASVGTAFKTISMRIRGYDEETEAFTNDVEVLSGKIADLTKTASKPGGISLFTDENKTTYKSTYQLLKEISTIYDDLTDKQQAGLLEALAGKRQGQIVAATITNFKAAEKAMDDMVNSAGNAEAEMDVIRDSAEYALNEMKETFTELSQNAVSRGELKALIKTGTLLLDIVNNIVKGIGAVPALLGTIFGIIGTKSKTLLSFNKYTGKFNLFGTELGKGWFSNFKANRAELKATANLVNELRTSFNGVTISEDMMNKVMASSSAELKGLVTCLKNGSITPAEFTTRLDGMSEKLKTVNMNAEALKSGLKSLGAAAVNIAASMGIAWAITTVIQSVSSAIDRAVKSYENNIKKIKDTNDEIKSLESSYDDLNDQLEESQKKLRELEKIPNPTLIEEAEIARLKEANKLLETQIKLKKVEIEQSKQKAIESAKEMSENYSGDFNTFGAFAEMWLDEDRGFIDKVVDTAFALYSKELALKNIGNFFQGNFWWQQEASIKKAQKALEKYNEAIDEYKNIGSGDYSEKEEEKIKKNKEKAEKELDERISKLKSRYLDWNIELSALELDPENNKERIEELKETIDAVEQLINYKNDFKDILDVYNNASFSNVKAELQELARAGELTAEKFDKLNDTDIKGIEAFKKALTEKGITDFSEIVRAITKEVANLDNEAGNTADSVDKMTAALKELYDLLDGVIEKQEALADTFKKIQLGGKLGIKEVYDLIKQIPEIAEYIRPSDNEYTIKPEGFSIISDELQKQTREATAKQLTNVRKQIAELEGSVKEKEELEKKAAELQAEMLSSPREELNRELADTGILLEEAESKCVGAEEALKELKNTENALIVTQKLLNEGFDETAVALEGINEAYDEAKSAISDYNNNIETIDNAIKTLGDGNLLSYDEMTALVDIAPELEDAFDQIGTQYTIQIEKLQELREESYKTRNDYIEDMKARAQAQIAALEASKQAFEQQKQDLNEMNLGGVAASQFAALDKNIADTVKQIDALVKVVQKFNGWQNELTIDTDEEDISDKLQKQIDHYKSIIEAVSAVRDRYTEVLDNEIDGLNDVKDALKDANDERERELQLQEAANDLENAKKRKVYVFKDGNFQQVQDEKAVKEAEEKYRDVITDIQEATIDKAIDERENKKKAIDDKIKDLIDAEKNIQNAMIISQAMKEYGLTDAKDLLTLSDDVKQGIIEGLAESTLQKDIEDNKENSEYTEVTLQSILKELGSTKNIDDIDPSVFNNMGKISKDNAVKGFTDKLKNDAQARIDNVTYNNAPIINANFTINNADDPQAVADTVHQELGNFLRQYCDSIK